MNADVATESLQIKIKFSNSEIQLHSIFEKETGIRARMVLDFDQHVFFFVDPEHFTLAAGQNFKNLRILHFLLRRRVHIIKFSPNPIGLLKYCFPSVQINDPVVLLNGTTRELVICVDPKIKGVIKGTDGHYLQLLNRIFARLFNIKKISLEVEAT